MTAFTADWLALREPADARARNAQVARALRMAFGGREGLHVLDLGAGTGANMRATAPLLPAGQRWTLVDSDPALLARVRTPDGVACTKRRADLAAGIAPLLTPRPDLVTASAFFDLAGAEWIDRLVRDLGRARLPLLAVLTYDGREEWGQRHPEDTAVHAAFLADQRRDKGLGPALGPEAHGHLSLRLAEAGYSVTEGASDWRLAAPRDAALIAERAEGIAAAVRPKLGARADRWLHDRRAAARVTIGHRDLLALPQSHEI